MHHPSLAVPSGLGPALAHARTIVRTIAGTIPRTLAASLPILLVMAAALAGGPAAAADRVRVYVGTYSGGGSEGIYLLDLDRSTGSLGEPRLAAKAEHAAFLALHPGFRHLYAVNETGTFQGERTGSVSAFEIDPATGALTLLDRKPTGGTGPCHLDVDATGRNVLVANYGGGSVCVWRLAEDGSFAERTAFVRHEGSGPNRRRQEAPHAHSADIDPTNRWAVVCDLGIDRVLVYRFDAEKGTIVPNEPPGAASKPGAGPRHFAFHPGGKHAYAINELSSTIAAYAWDGARGTLRELETISTLPEGFGGESTTAEVAVSPCGKRVYGSNRGHDSIAAFRIDQQRGTLSLVEIEPSGGKTPRSFGIEPSGRFLLAAHQGTGNLVAFRIEPETGALEPTGSEARVPNGVCVVFLEPAAEGADAGAGGGLPEAIAFPAGIAEGYAALAGAVVAEDIGAFMRLFDMDFVFEAADASSLDRGPWKRSWEEAFDDAEHETVAFVPEDVVESTDDRVAVRVRSVIVTRAPGDPPKVGEPGSPSAPSARLRETLLEDVWVVAEGAWQLILRTEKEVRTDGVVLEGLDGAPGSRARTAEAIPAPAVTGSPILGRLAVTRAVDAFWKGPGARGPLVEDCEAEEERLVTFIWRGRGDERSVALEGALGDPVLPRALARLEGTDVWHRTERLSADARTTYRFLLECAVAVSGGAVVAAAPSGRAAAVGAGSAAAPSGRAGARPVTFRVLSHAVDPRSPELVGERSLLELPAAPSPARTRPVDGRPSGRVERHSIDSAILGERRFVTVYTPPGYGSVPGGEGPGTAFKVALLVDGGDFQSRRIAGVLLDNLIAERVLPPLVVAMLHDEGSRTSHLAASASTARFVREELVPWIRKSFRVVEGPEGWTVGANGGGAELAALCALEVPILFGGAFLFCGDFSGSDVARGLTARVASGPKAPVRFRVATGTLERGKAVFASRSFRDALEAGGFDVSAEDFSGDRSPPNWLLALERGLPLLIE